MTPSRELASIALSRGPASDDDQKVDLQQYVGAVGVVGARVHWCIGALVHGCMGAVGAVGAVGIAVGAVSANLAGGGGQSYRRLALRHPNSTSSEKGYTGIERFALITGVSSNACISNARIRGCMQH